ncbi:MAG TPA: amidase [Candidatus Methylomirabilis sp.]|nr:amidase [Candidatus Methylomirabilis sp.]
MKLAEYATYDALGLAELVAKKKVTAKELALTAAQAIKAANPTINAVVETYADRIDGLDERTLGTGPFRGVPFLIKDVFGHEKGRKIEFGSRLCRDMVVEEGTYFVDSLKAAGVNILGRSAAPEYSMAATAESVLYGNTCNPWRQGYSAGGSTGGGQAAVTSGMVPIAHGSDIGGSIRIPASWCGGVGLKPSRGRVSIGPVVDEGGFGYSMNFVQTRTIRDAAAMLDCVSAPQPGDPFIIPRPAEPYAVLAARPAPKLRIGIVLDELTGARVDPEIIRAVEQTGQTLAAMGHTVERAPVDMGGAEVLRWTTDLFFFGFDLRLEGYAKRSGHTIGPETLEPVIYSVYEASKDISPARFFAATSALNVVRRRLGAFYTKYDVWLSPTTARVAEPWGRYHLSKPGVGWSNLIEEMFRIPCQFTIAHNIMGTPAMSLPLAMHSTGLPIGVQIAARPAEDHVVLQVGRALEEAMPWRSRVPPLHVSML